MATLVNVGSGQGQTAAQTVVSSRLVYLLEPQAVALNGLRAGTPYRLEWFNPVTGVRQPASELIADARGNAAVTPPEDEPHGWVAVITK